MSALHEACCPVKSKKEGSERTFEQVKQKLTNFDLYQLLLEIYIYCSSGFYYSLLLYIFIYLYIYIFIITYSSALHLFFLNNFSRQKMREIVGSDKAHQELLQVHHDYFTVKHFAGNVSL